MSPGEPVLIICHGFPPVFGIGGRRWAKFAKELARRGHPVHVIRSIAPKHATLSLWTGDVQHPNIIAHPLPQRYPSVLGKPLPLSLFDKLKYHAWLRILPLLTKDNWYDRAIFWGKQLPLKMEEIIRAHGIRNVIVTGAPFSLMTFAAASKARFPDVRFIADFRDQWTWGAYYGRGSMDPTRSRREQEQESFVIRSFDKVISPHANVLEHLCSSYHDDPDRFTLIPHAVDPGDLGELPVHRVGNEDGFTMVHFGSIYGGHEADHFFEQLIQAFERLKERDPQRFGKTRLDMYITSGDADRYENMVQARGLDDRIVFNAPTPPRELFPRIARSDLVLSFMSSDKANVIATKYNEVTCLNRPILHIGDPGSVSETIIGQGMGDSIRVEELAVELPRIISGERKIEIDTEADHSAFLLGPITDRLISEVLT